MNQIKDGRLLVHDRTDSCQNADSTSSHPQGHQQTVRPRRHDVVNGQPEFVFLFLNECVAMDRSRRSSFVHSRESRSLVRPSVRPLNSVGFLFDFDCREFSHAHARLYVSVSVSLHAVHSLNNNTQKREEGRDRIGQNPPLSHSQTKTRKTI